MDLAGEPVDPVALGQVDAPAPVGVRHRRHQQVVAEQPLVAQVPGGGVVGVVDDQGAGQGHPCRRGAVRLAEQVRQQPVAQVEQVAGHVGGGATAVELAVAEPVDAAVGQEQPGLEPADEQVVVGLAEEATDVHAPEREAAQAQGQAAGDVGEEVVPPCRGVAAPVERVALGAGEGRTGPDDPLAGRGVGRLGDRPVVEQRVAVVHPVAGCAVVVHAVEGSLFTEVDLDGPGPEVEQLAEPPLVHLDGGRVGEVDAPDPSSLPVR